MEAEKAWAENKEADTKLLWLKKETDGNRFRVILEICLNNYVYLTLLDKNQKGKIEVGSLLLWENLKIWIRGNETKFVMLYKKANFYRKTLF